MADERSIYGCVGAGRPEAKAFIDEVGGILYYTCPACRLLLAEPAPPATREVSLVSPGRPWSRPIAVIASVYFPKLRRIRTKGTHALLGVKPEEPGTETNPEADLTDLLQRLVRLLSGPRPCVHHAPEPDRALRLDEAAPLLAMSHDFVYRNWRRLDGYKDTDHHIKFRMSDIQRHLQRKAKESRP